MLNPQFLLVAVLYTIAMLAVGFFTGHDWATTKAEAAHAHALEVRIKGEAKLRDHADELSHALSIAEGRIITKTVEVIKYVPSVTTGAPCLNSATVSMLQPGTSASLRPPSSALTPEGAAPASSDTDIANWIAGANQQYETCAVRLNALVDWAEGI